MISGALIKRSREDQNKRTPLSVLLVEDNPADVAVLTYAMQAAESLIQISHIAQDGEEALDYLMHRSPYEDTPPPDLVLLDLNVPLKSGLVVLKELKASQYKRIPAIVFSSSSDKSDIDAAYESGASGYFLKPETVEGFEAFLRVLEAYWRQAILPPPQSPRKQTLAPHAQDEFHRRR